MSDTACILFINNSDKHAEILLFSDGADRTPMTVKAAE